MIKFQKNKTQLFECKIKIEGADKSTAKPRLILYPNNDSRNIFFEGIIEGDTCKISVLPNLNISQNGKAVLEVIVENSILFQPWKTEYEIVTEKVKVEEVHISTSNVGATIKVLEDDVKIDNNKIIKENKSSEIRKSKSVAKKGKSFGDLLEEAAGMIQDDTEKNKQILKAYQQSIKSLTKKDLSEMVKYVTTNYIPTKESLSWSKQVLGETKSIKSKLLMYCNDIKIK